MFTFGIVIIISGSGHSTLNNFVLYSGSFYCYLLGYSLLAAFIRRVFLEDYIDIRNTWVVALLTCAIFSILPILAGGIVGMNSDTLFIGNPLYVATVRHSDLVLIFSAGLAIVGLILNIGWLSRQFNDYHQKMDA